MSEYNSPFNSKHSRIPRSAFSQFLASGCFCVACFVAKRWSQCQHFGPKS